MALLIGALLALAVGLFAAGVGLDRDRAFYATVAIVVATYYALFAAMGASTGVLVQEAMVGLVFVAVATAGFRGSMWLVVLALAGHGLFDAVHGQVIANPGMPRWWPAFCGAYDVVAAACLAWLLKRGRLRAATGPASGPGPA